jgi:hypothetical protein
VSHTKVGLWKVGAHAKEKIGHKMGRVYEWLLRLPVAIVLGVLWLIGAMLVGACAMVLFLLSHWGVRVLW